MEGSSCSRSGGEGWGSMPIMCGLSPTRLAALRSHKRPRPALFDTYYGKSPVSPAAKEGAATGFASRGFYRA